MPTLSPALIKQSVKLLVPAVKNKILVAWGLDEYNFSWAHTTGATSQKSNAQVFD